MAESETPKASGKPSVDHAKKWWWLTALVLPIALAIFNKYPFSNSPVHGTTYIASMTVIGQQYQQQFNGQTIDPAVIERLQQANALAKDSNFQGAAAVLQEVAQKAPVPAVLNNLGVVYQGAGDSQRPKKRTSRSALRVAVARRVRTPSTSRNNKKRCATHSRRFANGWEWQEV